ncbi:unnamed protein product, partial [Ectocarpus sp. 13 AM-2016]
VNSLCPPSITVGKNCILSGNPLSPPQISATESGVGIGVLACFKDSTASPSRPRSGDEGLALSFHQCILACDTTSPCSQRRERRDRAHRRPGPAKRKSTPHR